MKTTLALSMLAALLAGCAIAPYGYGDHRDGYYQERGDRRSDGSYRDRSYNRGDGHYGSYSRRGEYATPGDPFRESGN